MGDGPGRLSTSASRPLASQLSVLLDPQRASDRTQLAAPVASMEGGSALPIRMSGTL